MFANPTECSLCPSHFPELQFVSASALHAVFSQKPHLTGCICPQTMIEAVRWSLHLSHAVKTAQGAAGTGPHTPKCPLSRASSVGCLLSLLGDSVEPQSRLSEGVNREEETAGRAVWMWNISAPSQCLTGSLLRLASEQTKTFLSHQKNKW